MDDGVKIGPSTGPDSSNNDSKPGDMVAQAPMTFANSVIESNAPLSDDQPGPANPTDQEEGTRVSAYARLDFDSFTFYVQTLQVVLGRRAQNGQNMVDVHLGAAKAISRRHAKIFYNFATQRFELTVMGRNGAFVGDVFVENGSTVPLSDGKSVQIGQINFKFVLPQVPKDETREDPDATEIQHQELHDPDADTDSNNEDETNFFAVQEKKKPKQRPASVSSGPPSAPLPREKPKKREYRPEEIPEQYREKPAHSYSVLITRALQERAPEQGLSLADIYEAIKELFPYYQYCADGWQNSVRHNLSSSKAFRKVSKEGKGWLWGLDQEYINEKEQKKAASKQRRVSHSSNDKSIAELAQEIPPRRPSETQRPRSDSGNLLSPALLRLLSRLQNQLQGHLAKAGGKSINPNILSNALANVVARAAKASGGIDQLEQLLQSPQQVNLILVQTLEFVKSQRQRRPSELSNPDGTPSASGVTPGASGFTPGPATPGTTMSHQEPAVKDELRPAPGAPPSASVPPTIKTEAEPEPATTVPKSEETSSSSANSASTDPEASKANSQKISQVEASTASQAAPATPSEPPAPAESTAPSAGPKAASASTKPAQAPQQPAAASSLAGPSEGTAAPATAPAASGAKPKFTPEQIAQLIAKAEQVPNPKPSLLAALEQLRAHQRAMLKRPADSDGPSAKRPATTNEA